MRKECPYSLQGEAREINEILRSETGLTVERFEYGHCYKHFEAWSHQNCHAYRKINSPCDLNFQPSN